MGLFFYTKIGSIISIGDLPTTNIIEPKRGPVDLFFRPGWVFFSRALKWESELGSGWASFSDPVGSFFTR